MAKKSQPTQKSTPKVSDTSTERIPQAPDGAKEARVTSDDQNLVQQMNFLNTIGKPSFQSAADSRRKYDQEWLGRNLFWRGYQFSRYLPSTQTVILAVRQSARVPVNLTAAYMRSIRNQVTSFRPKFEVLPTSPNNDSASNQARYAQRLLDYYFDHLKLKMKIKETIIQALMYSIGGPWQIVYDKLSGEIKVWLLDPFDFYMDPLAEDPNEAEYMIKASRQPVGWVVNNPEFSLMARQEIKSGDSILAASPQKQFLIQSTRIVSPKTIDSAPNLILYEGYFRRYNSQGKCYMVKCIWTTQNTIPLVYEEIDTDEFDFVVYRGDIVPKEPYGESWMKHVMPINRVINTLESSALEYNTRIAKGRIVVDRDSGVRSIHNVHGEIISKNRGATVAPLELPTLPNAVPDQVERMWKYAMDISGVHEATLGSVPQGVRTGVAIAELKQADSSSQDDLVDNLEDFLSDVAFKMLKKIAQNYDSYKVIKDLGIRDGDEKYFAVIGKQFSKGKSKAGDKLGKPGQVKIGTDWFDVAEIDEDNTIRVGVGSWLGYTKEALQQKVMSYYQAGLLDQATTLQLLEFGDIDSIVQKTRMEQLLKRAASTQPNQNGGPDQMDLAMAENDMILDGSIRTPRDAMALVTPDQDHMVHIAIHQDALGKGQDQLVGALIEAHKIHLVTGVGMNPLQLRQNLSQGQPQGNQPQPQTQGQVPPPAPQGPPAGTQLPQQNIPQQMVQNQNTAAGNMAPITGR